MRGTRTTTRARKRAEPGPIMCDFCKKDIRKAVNLVIMGMTVMHLRCYDRATTSKRRR
jgi:hypothetical protein